MKSKCEQVITMASSDTFFPLVILNDLLDKEEMGSETFGTEFVLCNVWFAETRREMTAVSQDSSTAGRAV